MKAKKQIKRMKKRMVRLEDQIDAVSRRLTLVEAAAHYHPIEEVPASEQQS